MKDLQKIIDKCEKCKLDSTISNFITYKKPKLYFGSDSPKIMLIGHSPRVRSKEQADVVLKLDKENQPLYKYIKTYILQPIGFNISDIYATNLVKCNTYKLPEEINKKVIFFDSSFTFCKELLEKEILTINPEIIISLSERVLKILSKNYLEKELNMKNSFAKIFSLIIKNKQFIYIPVVHIPKGAKSKVGMHYFPEQTNRLKDLKNQIKLCSN